MSNSIKMHAAQNWHQTCIKSTNEKVRYQLSSILSIFAVDLLVGTERFELSTYGLRVRCSTN